MTTGNEKRPMNRTPGQVHAPAGRPIQAGEDAMPPIVRKVLLASLVASVVALGLLAIIHLVQNAAPHRLPAETERMPATIPLGRKAAFG